MKYQMLNDQAKLMYEISMLDFIVIDLVEFLDTHANDHEALEYFNHFNRLSNQAKKEYASKYGPLEVSLSEPCSNEWKWAMQPLPWEGVC